MKVKNLCVGGGGVMGSQIAFQAAFKGYNVKVWSRRPISMEKTKKRIDVLKERYHKMLDVMATPKGKTKLYFCKGLYDGDPQTFTKEIAEKLKVQVDKGYESIQHTLDIGEASKDSDFVIEAIIENKKIKSEFFQNLAKVCPEKTIITTNTSSLLPSMFAEDSGRPEKFFAFHYSADQWISNIVEIMPQEKTNPIYLDVAEDFAKGLGMIPIRMKKEIKGYIMNSLVAPLDRAVLELWADDVVSDYKQIDKCWEINTGDLWPPFKMLDSTGLMVIQYIFSSIPDAQDPNTINGKILAKINERIDKGLLGMETREGFYKYGEEYY